MKAKIVILFLIFISNNVLSQEELKVHSKGYGAVLVGMTPKEAGTLLDTGFRIKEAPFSEIEVCHVISPDNGPEGLSFMVEDGRIASVWINYGQIMTDKGIKIGDEAVKVEGIYGSSLTREEGKYMTNTYDYFVWEDDKKTGIKYGISEGVVDGIYSGNKTIQLVEGPCM